MWYADGKWESIFNEDLTYQIIGAAFEVHKQLGPVHKEIVYQKALESEFTSRKLPFESQARLPVVYRNKKVGVYCPDFIVDKKVIVEIKAVDFLPVKHEVQLSYYLKATKYKLGLLLNFGKSRLVVRRRIYDTSR